MTILPGFDPLIHARARVQLIAVLSGVDDMEFATARELLQVSDSVLSKHIALLCNAGYVRLRKSAVMGRQRTWLSITNLGQSAYDGHVSALRSLLDQSGPATATALAQT